MPARFGDVSFNAFGKNFRDEAMGYLPGPRIRINIIKACSRTSKWSYVRVQAILTDQKVGEVIFRM